MVFAEPPAAWSPRRLPPAAAAVAATALLLMPFLAGPPPAGTAPQQVRPASMEVRLLAIERSAAPAPAAAPVRAPYPSPTPRRLGPSAPEPATARLPQAPPAIGLVPVPERPAAPPPAITPTGPPAESATAPAMAPARPPLQLDAATLGRAARQSGGEFRRLAESSGAYAGDPPVTAPERFEQAVRQAGKPDCLRPGGSLLSAPVIAYELLTDRCSVR